MARIRTRTLSWDVHPDAKSYLIYAGAASVGAAWLADVDAGKIPPLATVNAPVVSYTFAPNELADGNWQFAVCAQDAAGNIADPAQTPKVANVPFDGTPPTPVTGLSIT